MQQFAVPCAVLVALALATADPASAQYQSTYVKPYSTSPSTDVCTTQTSVWKTAISGVVANVPSNRVLQLEYSTEVAQTGNPAQPNQVQFRVLVDDSVQPLQPYTNPSGTNYYNSFAFNWFKTPLAAGIHTVKVQFRATGAGDRGCVRQQTLLLEY